MEDTDPNEHRLILFGAGARTEAEGFAHDLVNLVQLEGDRL